MRSVINWKVLLGLSIALTLVLFYSLLSDLKSNRDQAQGIVNDFKRSAEVAEGNNEKLKFLLDSVTTEFAQLQARITLLETQKDSLSKGISRPKAKSVMSDPAQDYYMNCGNIVQIDIPKKYTSTKLKYSSENAHILETPDLGRIIMFPYHSKVRIVIESGGTAISEVEFQNIKNVPAPTYQVYQGNQKIDLKRGAMGKTLTSLSVVAEPDPNFRDAVPKDARYLCKRWELNVTRGSSVILRRVCTSESVDLRAERSLFKPGDIVHISAMEFVRITFHDEKEMIALPPGVILTFPIF